MPLIKLDEYLDTYFTARSRPSIYSVRRWIRQQKLPAEKHGRSYYIDTDKLDAKPCLEGSVDTVALEDDPLLNKILEKKRA